MQNDRRTYRRPREPEDSRKSGWSYLDQLNKLGGSYTPDQGRNLVNGRPPTGCNEPDVGGRIRRKYGGPPLLKCHSSESSLPAHLRSKNFGGPAGQAGNPEDWIPAYAGMTGTECDVGLLWDELLSSKWTTTWMKDKIILNDEYRTMDHRRMQIYPELVEWCRN